MKKTLILVPCLLFLASLFAYAAGASLYLSLSAGSYEVGSTFYVDVLVSSTDQTMNAVSGVLDFPSDRLEAVSLSKDGSIMSLWVQEPTFSNKTGTVNFEGIVLNPGFTGSAGKALSVRFRAKAAGDAFLKFLSGSVLANDGLGSNILSNLSGISLVIKAKSSAPAASQSSTPAPASGTPDAPKITSPTHPNPDAWYADKNPKYRWEVPDDVTAIRLSFDRFPTSTPVIIYDEPVSEKELFEVSDGTWYFHVQMRNRYGWGGVSHFRSQIDAQPPQSFAITFADGKESDNPSPVLRFEAQDEISGIDHYQIKLVGGESYISDKESFTFSPLRPGSYTVLVQAFDKAQNFSVASEEFTVLSIDPPTITELSYQLEVDRPFVMKGKTYPNGQARVYLKYQDAEATTHLVRSDAEGNFVFIPETNLREGTYFIWTEAIDARGAVSVPTKRETFVVTAPVMSDVGKTLMKYFSALVVLIAMIAGILVLLLYLWYRILMLRGRLKKKARDAEETLHKAFALLREDALEQVAMLEKLRETRKLTREEQDKMETLKADMKDAEKYIEKGIKDIEDIEGV